MASIFLIPISDLSLKPQLDSFLSYYFLINDSFLSCSTSPLPTRQLIASCLLTLSYHTQPLRTRQLIASCLLPCVGSPLSLSSMISESYFSLYFLLFLILSLFQANRYLVFAIVIFDFSHFLHFKLCLYLIFSL